MHLRGLMSESKTVITNVRECKKHYNLICTQVLGVGNWLTRRTWIKASLYIINLLASGSGSVATINRLK